ncbi:MAG: hypothetical protein K6D95_04720 [Treponema sp.]|nr:hypothetical protein [Treponema sp.]
MTEEQIRNKASIAYLKWLPETHPEVIENEDEYEEYANGLVEGWYGGYEEATKELQEQIEKMKCCGNCIHCYEGAYHNGYRCKDHAKESVCDNWEMMTDEVRKEILEDD